MGPHSSGTVKNKSPKPACLVTKPIRHLLCLPWPVRASQLQLSSWDGAWVSRNEQTNNNCKFQEAYRSLSDRSMKTFACRFCSRWRSLRQACCFHWSTSPCTDKIQKHHRRSPKPQPPTRSPFPMDRRMDVLSPCRGCSSQRDRAGGCCHNPNPSPAGCPGAAAGSAVTPRSEPASRWPAGGGTG